MTTFGDQVFQYGGMPVGADHRFDGWWGGNVYFVDFDNGTPGASGEGDMDRPAKDLQRAIDDATTDATIYVRPRAFAAGTYGEDPQEITPSASDAENFHIDKAKKNTSLIATGRGSSHAAARKCWIGGYAGLTTAVLEVRAPGCVIEGFRSDPPASAAEGIFRSQNDGSTFDGGNTTFINNDLYDANTSGALQLDSTWDMAIIGNRFLNCDYGILVQTLYSVPQVWEIAHNTFQGEASEVYGNVYSNGGLKRLNAHHNIHSGEQPSGGGDNMYYYFGNTSTGSITGDHFGAYDVTAEALCTLNGVNINGCYSGEGLVIEAS